MDGLRNTSRDTSTGRTTVAWMAGGLLLVILAAAGLRYGTDILEIGRRIDQTRFRYDERWITTPINAIVQHGWTIETAIDFEETKGPAMIWPYALWGQVVSGDLNTLRALSVLLFSIGVVPLLWIARRCHVHGAGLIAVAGLYALLPYNAMLGQLVMSEPMFNLFAALLMAIVFWGLGVGTCRAHRVAGPLLFGVLLAVALHNRLHAVAFAGAACLVAFERDRWRSWPWWLACVMAGLSRLPLWARWGGPVSPRFQSQHDVGLGLECLSYLAAAMTPLLVVFLVPIVIEVVRRRRFSSDHWPVVLGAAAGVVLGIVATPELGQKLPFEGGAIARYLGTIASLVRAASDTPGGQGSLLTVLSSVGLASLGGLVTLSWRTSRDDSSGVAGRLMLWTLLTGWAMYALTAASVFDRYLLPWAILAPVVYVRLLPRWLCVVQALLLALIAGQHAWSWLVVH